MRVRIDASRCEGHGRCYMLAPAVFDADENGSGTVIAEEIDDASIAAATLARDNCPEDAIVLIADE